MNGELGMWRENRRQNILFGIDQIFTPHPVTRNEDQSQETSGEEQGNIRLSVKPSR